jgi:hypothetical protein
LGECSCVITLCKNREYLGKDYLLLKSENLNASHLMIFINKRISDQIDHLGSNSIKTGFYNMTGNKGAVSVWFRFKEISFIFINCHLAGIILIKIKAGQNYTKKRNENLERILKNMNFFNIEKLKNSFSSSNLFSENGTEDIPLNFDYSFVMGDFNYRIDGELSYISNCLKQNQYEDLIKYDQMRIQIECGDLKLKKFSEGEIKFPPTFKFYVGTSIYNFTDNKFPGWTDRIM